MSYPAVLKPVSEGSSVGIVFLKSADDLHEHIDIDKNIKRFMLEKYIAGREMTVAVLNGKALAVTEIIPKNGFYDYDAKYSVGGSSHYIPADISDELSQKMMDYVTNVAKEVGLEYHFEKAVVANSYDAHRFTHLAKTKGLQIAAEEQLFAAYFSEGKNTADHTVLAQLGAAIGLEAEETTAMLKGKTFSAEVDQDLILARQFGINSVPFFVFDRKLAVSGAQDPQVFLNTLQKVQQQ